MTPTERHIGQLVRLRSTGEVLGRATGWATGSSRGTRVLIALDEGGERWESADKLDADPLPPRSEESPLD